MNSFSPQKILLETRAKDYPLTRRVLKNLNQVPIEEIKDFKTYKEPQGMTQAKRILAIGLQKGQVLKPFPKIKESINLGDFVFNPISNCHLECTYCILQSYLKNNPILTLFANVEDYLAEIKNLVLSQTDKIFRIGTGELSDSLALDPLTQLSHDFIPFFSKLPNAYLELKTKSDHVEGLLDLEHGGRTVLSWSLAPDLIIKQEELKCASLGQRLEAARQAQRAGYPIGLHLDPMIYFLDWDRAYSEMLQEIKNKLDPKRIAWVSMGTLRFDKELKMIAGQRFPHSKIFSGDLVPGPDGKIRYFKTLRKSLYQKIWQELSDWSAQFPRYLCMEPPWMWEEVTGHLPPAADSVEQSLSKRLQDLRLGL